MKMIKENIIKEPVKEEIAIDDLKSAPVVTESVAYREATTDELIERELETLKELKAKKLFELKKEKDAFQKQKAYDKELLEKTVVVLKAVLKAIYAYNRMGNKQKLDSDILNKITAIVNEGDNNA